MTGKQGRFAVYWEKQLDNLERIEAKRAHKLPRWRTTKRRRNLVVLAVAGDLLLIVGAVMLRSPQPWVFTALWFTGCLVGGVPYYLLRILTGRMSSSFSRLLDEREREWRHRVTYIGYQTLAAMTVIGMLYLLLIAKQADAAVRGAIMFAALLTAGSTVPTLVLGWTLLDDDPEDLAEEGNHLA